MTGTLCQSERRDRNLELILRCRDGDKTAEEELVTSNAGLVRSIAERFVGRGAEPDDLYQLGMIGMVRAIRTFDPERGCAFSTYAVPLIMGEIRRFLRDDGMIKVSREKKRLGSRLLSEREKIMAGSGREPAISELADKCGVDIYEAAEALSCVSPVLSIFDPAYGDSELTISDTIASPDVADDEAERLALREVTSSLPPVWRKIISLRYYHDMSQEATARALGLSQVKVSREEKKIFAYMRERLC
ncbi:MAG: sigma-70 family RNA polymerase sigma factor [Firmicutes bacterium]|nr:sigma-70 family RNA polymerase sigma factor [Bacillota bacterium]